MVLESLESTLFLVITIFASLAAILGIVVLEGFFRNKLKDLFTDVNYFVFFFIVSGYFLYALGEVSFFLTRSVFKDVTAVGIQDVYWTGGGFLIFVSFLALSILLHREYGGAGKFLTQVLFGGALVVLVAALALEFSQKNQEYNFGIYYPIISSLIIAASLSVVLYMGQLRGIARPLLIFFIASGGILIGDLFFSFGAAQLTYGTTGLLADIFYLIGYATSGIGFLSLRLRMNQLAFKNENNRNKKLA